jgi:hypothetical protein
MHVSQPGLVTVSLVMHAGALIARVTEERMASSQPHTMTGAQVRHS